MFSSGFYRILNKLPSLRSLHYAKKLKLFVKMYYYYFGIFALRALKLIQFGEAKLYFLTTFCSSALVRMQMTLIYFFLPCVFISLYLEENGITVFFLRHFFYNTTIIWTSVLCLRFSIIEPSRSDGQGENSSRNFSNLKL